MERRECRKQTKGQQPEPADTPCRNEPAHCSDLCGSLNSSVLAM